MIDPFFHVQLKYRFFLPVGSLDLISISIPELDFSQDATNTKPIFHRIDRPVLGFAYQGLPGYFVPLKATLPKQVTVHAKVRATLMGKCGTFVFEVDREAIYRLSNLEQSLYGGVSFSNTHAMPIQMREESLIFLNVGSSSPNASRANGSTRVNGVRFEPMSLLEKWPATKDCQLSVYTDEWLTPLTEEEAWMMKYRRPLNYL